MNAIAQLTRMTPHSGTSLNLRWPYQAKVMNTLEQISRPIGIRWGDENENGMLCSQCAVDGIVPVGTERAAVAIPCQFRYEIASSRRGIMTIRLISAATLIAGLLTA